VPAGTYSIGRVASGGGPICIKGAGKGATNIKVPSASASPNSFRFFNGGSLGLFNLTFIGFKKSSAPGDFWGNIRLDDLGAHLHAEGVEIRNSGWGDGQKGALDVTSGATASLTDTDFFGCASLRDGGAIFVSAGSSVELHGTTTFVGNFATQKGGAVAAYGPVVFNGPVVAVNTSVSNSYPDGCAVGRAPAPAGARAAPERGRGRGRWGVEKVGAGRGRQKPAIAPHASGLARSLVRLAAERAPFGLRSPSPPRKPSTACGAPACVCLCCDAALKRYVPPPPPVAPSSAGAGCVAERAERGGRASADR
jgi:predicted outer membrane repeat protein